MPVLENSSGLIATGSYMGNVFAKTTVVVLSVAIVVFGAYYILTDKERGKRKWREKEAPEEEKRKNKF